MSKLLSTNLKMELARKMHLGSYENIAVCESKNGPSNKYGANMVRV